MKGVVFTELMDLVEKEFGYEVVDQMIIDANLDNDGAFTAIGTYDHSDLVQMVVSLSQQTGIEFPVLVKLFGKHLFGVFAKKHIDKIAGMNSAFSVIENVENFIHVEVRKIYPDAQLPNFEYEYENDSTLIVKYRSERPFADLCEGLIEACIANFNDEIELERIDVAHNGTAANFRLEQKTTPALS